MEDQKIIKGRSLGGREITYIIDKRLNGVAQRTKLPQKYVEANERIRKMKNIPK